MVRFFLSVALFVLICFAYQEFDHSKKSIEAKDLIQKAMQGETQEFDYFMQQALELLANDTMGNRSIKPEVSATIYYIKSSREDNESKLKELYLTIKSYYFDFLAKSPTSARYWALAANMKWQLNETDSEFYKYLELANNYGQHEPHTHIQITSIARQMIESGFPISSDIERIFKHHFYFGLAHPRSRTTISISVKRASLLKETVCKWLDKGSGQAKRVKC